MGSARRAWPGGPATRDPVSKEISEQEEQRLPGMGHVWWGRVV